MNAKIRIRHAATALMLPLAALALPAVTVGAQAATSGSASEGVMQLSVGESRVINLSGRMSDLVVADPAVVDVSVRSATQLFIMGKGPGESTVYATAANGKILYSIKVRVGNNLTSIGQMLKLAMPEADISVSTLNGVTLLTGTIKAPEDAAEAERLVQAFVGKDVTVVSRLRTATPLQVSLQVKIAEVNRNLLHKIGTNLTGLGTGSGSFSGYIGRSTRSAITTGNFVPSVNMNDQITRQFTFTQPTDNTNTLGFVAKMFGMDIAGALDLAEQTGIATSLAEPTLTALSGETASFLAGGEIPYQIVDNTGTYSIQYKSYGVQLAFTPTVLADGRISMRVRPTVSQPDTSLSTANGIALRNRSVETTVELGSGQAFMLAGLLDNSTANAIDKMPGLGNLPIIGNLFKSRSFRRNETELVIVVVPYLVKPMNASEVRLPTDGFRNATEAQGFLLQQGEDGVSGKKEPQPRIAPSAPPADPASPQAFGPAAAPAPAPTQPNKVTKAAANNAAAPGFSF